MEVRGVGLVEVKSLMEAELALVVDLMPAAEIERLPEGNAKARLLGIELPLVALFPWETSAPIKLAIALARAKHS
jgi:serine kinase of HPr protein (carbohydrate metabolism regulator)